mgnify:CR=1 FL=1
MHANESILGLHCTELLTTDILGNYFSPSEIKMQRIASTHASLNFTLSHHTVPSYALPIKVDSLDDRAISDEEPRI